jgi:hypothetical protein
MTYAEQVGLITHLAPNRRQRLIRRRWLMVAAVAAAVAAALLAGQLNQRSASDVASRTAGPAVISGR